jgi:anti-sigma factor RsiW
MEGSPNPPSRAGEGDQYVLWDAAYVLGSLSDADRCEYEAHLRDCRSCIQSVDELRGLPALLGHLTADEVIAIDDGVSETLAPSRGQMLTLPPARASRRRRVTRVAILSAAAAVIVLGVLAGTQSHWGSTTSVLRADSSAVTMIAVAPTELTATVAVTGHDWGTQIEMNCTYPVEVSTSAPDADELSRKLAMVVVGRDGRQDRLATWMAVDGVRATPAGSTSMPIDQIAAVEIVSADTGDALLERTM